QVARNQTIGIYLSVQQKAVRHALSVAEGHPKRVCAAFFRYLRTGQRRTAPMMHTVIEMGIQYKVTVFSGTLSQGFCSCSRVSAMIFFLTGTNRTMNPSSTQQYKYRVKEKEYPFTMALGTRRMSPTKGARVILCFVLGVGMHQRIAATWTMVTTPAMRTQPSLDT
ncbi:hypothetical protein ABZT28_54720, partial [Streptomyces sp. NPDC005388]|uniref:hypothetical protein n=1 Tax=Streptomyces sp. NPDC005388 TaxID=3156717 RepID=UPI0033BED594